MPFWDPGASSGAGATLQTAYDGGDGTIALSAASKPFVVKSGGTTYLQVFGIAGNSWLESTNWLVNLGVKDMRV